MLARVTCDYCHKPIYRQPSAIKKGVFCSQEHNDLLLKSQWLKKFWSNVKQRGYGCWEWKGARDSKGYARISFGVRKGRSTLAHRFSFELHYGRIPIGKFVLHKCHNPECVNPYHLKIGDHDENMNDMKISRRAACGRRNSNAKFTEQQVLWIRKAHANRKFTYAELARRFHVSATAIRLIVIRQNWKFI